MQGLLSKGIQTTPGSIRGQICSSVDNAFSIIAIRSKRGGYGVPYRFSTTINKSRNRSSAKVCTRSLQKKFERNDRETSQMTESEFARHCLKIVVKNIYRTVNHSVILRGASQTSQILAPSSGLPQDEKHAVLSVQSCNRAIALQLETSLIFPLVILLFISNDMIWFRGDCSLFWFLFQFVSFEMGGSIDALGRYRSPSGQLSYVSFQKLHLPHIWKSHNLNSP